MRERKSASLFCTKTRHLHSKIVLTLKDKMKEAVSSSSTTMIENVEFPSPQRFEMTKTRQKLHKKNLWNWLVTLMIATIWKYEVHAITGNGNYANLLKLIRKISEITIKVNLFLAGFRHLEPMCSLKQPLASLADKVLYPGCNDQRRSSQSDIASKLESVIGSKVSRLKREIYFRMSTMKPT